MGKGRACAHAMAKFSDCRGPHTEGAAAPFPPASPPPEAATTAAEMNVKELILP